MPIGPFLAAAQHAGKHDCDYDGSNHGLSTHGLGSGFIGFHGSPFSYGSYLIDSFRGSLKYRRIRNLDRT